MCSFPSLFPVQTSASDTLPGQDVPPEMWALINFNQHDSSPHSLGHGHNYRQIGRRAALYYGTTKEAWEAGRAW
ncbi:hypothetical protein JCM10207_004167 [Rhodosporidiobolus poonsookiae]